MAHPVLVEPPMQTIGLALAADDHLGGVLGDDGTAERVHVEVGTEQDDLVSPVAQPPGCVAGAISIEPTHHDAPSGHGHSVTCAGEHPHTVPLRAAVTPPLTRFRFDVTCESPRLYEFLLSTRRFPA